MMFNSLVTRLLGVDWGIKMNKEELIIMLILLSKIEGAMSYRDLPVDLSNELSGFIADVAHTIKEM